MSDTTTITDAYLLDTSVAAIAWDGAHPDHEYIRKEIAGLGDSPIFVCAVSIGEKEYGLQISPGVDLERRQAVRHAFNQYQVWSVDHHTSLIYGQLRGSLFKRYATPKKKGRLKEKSPESLIDRTTARELGIQENDLWIVSVAVQYDLAFITRDRGEGMRRILAIAEEEFGYNRATLWRIPVATDGKENAED